MQWLNDEVERLKAWWQTGSSASEIGRLLKRSRNAVLGKIDRLGLVNHGPIKKGYKFKPPTKRTTANQNRLKLQPDLPHNDGISILHLKDDSCRAVIGRGNDGSARYCGWQSIPGRSWCPHHFDQYVEIRRK